MGNDRGGPLNEPVSGEETSVGLIMGVGLPLSESDSVPSDVLTGAVVLDSRTVTFSPGSPDCESTGMPAKKKPIVSNNKAKA